MTFIHNLVVVREDSEDILSGEWTCGERSTHATRVKPAELSRRRGGMPPQLRRQEAAALHMPCRNVTCVASYLSSASTYLFCNASILGSSGTSALT